MSALSKSAIKKGILVIGIFALLAIIIFLLLFCFNDYRRGKRHDLEKLATEEYNAIFCSTYSIENFSQDDFATYRGVNTLKLDTVLRNTSDMEKYISAAFASENTISNVFLGLDSEQLWRSSNKSSEKLSVELNKNLLTLIAANPQVSFEVLLSAPSMEYWTPKSETEIDTLMAVNSSLIFLLNQYTNVNVFFYGDEEWLISNSGNYVTSYAMNPQISQKLFLYTICDGHYRITPDTASNRLEKLKQSILQEQATPTEYPDLSSWDLVFLGDSIIGNYTGTSSVPGVVTCLSNARTYNLGIGGTSAANVPSTDFSFPEVIDLFVSQNISQVPEEAHFVASLEQYTRDDHTDKPLCFVINYGLNDYFIGYPVDNPENPYDEATYAGALRAGITKLQSTYPDADILLMIPNIVTLFENGTMPLSEKGDVLTEYVNAALQVADEMNVICLNNYTDLGINESNANEYLLDGVHLNEAGRYLLAKRIILQISSLTP